MTARYIDFAGYEGCVRLANATTEVVMGHHYGGRILAYRWEGEEALMLDPGQNGAVYTPGQDQGFGPSGGRFDIGPEMTIPKHPLLWRGAWEVAITGDWSARMTSVEDPETGVQLVRDVTLAPEGSRLTCTQTIRNVSDRVTHWCHWSRTFGQGHGICVVPLTSPSRFPKRYVMYGPGPVINFAPDDPHIEVRDDVLLVLDATARPKLGLDTMAGWFAYLMPNNLLFVKQFPTYPDRVYNEIAGLTLSLWYFRDRVCELEPIGPRELLAPGESASFTETWALAPYVFPEPRSAVDPDDVRSVVDTLLGS
jgi:hypothetical protein